ncbi:MAG TPA: MOSC domain-containing protein [Epsilonproteobacteria bacterium]|nr:MOSC domain-containing protein [Campylobacterota bacterium]
MTGSGKVLELYISLEGDTPRSTKEEIFVDEKGVVGDKFYGRDTQRSILITAVESYNLAKRRGIDIPLGSLGENILVDYDPYDIPVGTPFQIGDALLEITQNCTLCKSLTKIDSKLPKLLKDDRGVFAKVLKNGMIRIGDTLKVDTSN